MSVNPENERILIVGSGIIGIACAHYLSKAGFQVTVIDQGTIGGACSHANCGYVCPSHVLPLTEPGAMTTAIKSFFNPNAPFRVKPRLSPAFWNWMWQFARRCRHRPMLAAAEHLKAILDSSIAEYRRLLKEESLECQWKEDGLLYVMNTDKGMQSFAETNRMLTDRFGVTARRIEGKDLTALDPSLREGLPGAFHYEGDAHLRSDLLNKNWSNRLQQQGVIFIERCKLQSVEMTAGKITHLETSRGTMQADRFVFAIGAWSARLAALLGCRIPVEPGKGYSVTMTRPETCPRFPILFPEHKVGLTPFDDGCRLGSMMEFTGFDSSIPPRRIRQLKESANHYLLNPINETTQEEWFGWRPMTWDSLPIIGRVPDLKNAFLATGHNMLGLSLAAATGKLISEIVQDIPTHIDSLAFAPSRF